MKNQEKTYWYDTRKGMSFEKEEMGLISSGFDHLCSLSRSFNGKDQSGKARSMGYIDLNGRGRQAITLANRNGLPESDGARHGSKIVFQERPALVVRIDRFVAGRDF